MVTELLGDEQLQICEIQNNYRNIYITLLSDACLTGPDDVIDVLFLIFIMA